MDAFRSSFMVWTEHIEQTATQKYESRKRMFVDMHRRYETWYSHSMLLPKLLCELMAK